MQKIAIPESELSWSFARSSGPGGQNVNKVASKAVLRWNALASQALSAEAKNRLQAQVGHRMASSGDIVLSSERFRSQERNRRDCLEKLATILERASRPSKIRKATRPSAASRKRRLETKRHRSSRKIQRKRPVID
jgi:ribosome-associated protein